MDLELVSFKICPYVQRSRISLLHKGIEHKTTYIELSDPPAWFQAKSPLGKVPILLVHGEGGKEDVLFESVVINEFVDEVSEDKGRLMPADPIQRAHTRAWIEFGSQCLMDFYMASVRDEAAHVEHVDALNAKLARLNDQVAGPFFFGETFTLADAALAPLLMRLDWFESRAPSFALAKFPKLAAWREQLLAMPAVQNSIVPEWKELQDDYVTKSNSFLGSLILAA